MNKRIYVALELTNKRTNEQNGVFLPGFGEISGYVALFRSETGEYLKALSNKRIVERFNWQA